MGRGKEKQSEEAEEKGITTPPDGWIPDLRTARAGRWRHLKLIENADIGDQHRTGHFHDGTNTVLGTGSTRGVYLSE